MDPSYRYMAIRQLLKLRDIQKKRTILPDLESVDRYFAFVDGEKAKYGDKAMDLLDRIRLAPPTDYPKDPFSREYADFQMTLYKKIAGKNIYQAALDEKNPVDIDKLRNTPFPYCTQNHARVADHLMAQSHLIRQWQRPPGSRIVEFGPGWGDLTFKLARMGYEMTVVEICPAMCELLEYRAKQLKQKITIKNEGMLDFQATETFEVAIFFESFHHCEDHLKMLEKTHKMLNDSGLLIFGSEPITYFPSPWGLRLDGHSLWAIRRHGWLELGFDSQYFKEVLTKVGFDSTLYRDRNYHIAKCILAKKI